MSRFNLDALFAHADAGLNVGRVLSQRLRPFLLQQVTPAQPGRGSSNVIISDFIHAPENSPVVSFSTTGQVQPGDELFDVNELPLLQGMFGTNPQRWRAFSSLVITDSLSPQAIRADMLLNGGETVDEIINRAIAWKQLVMAEYPDRFEGLTTDETYEIAIRVSAGWREW